MEPLRRLQPPVTASRRGSDARNRQSRPAGDAQLQAGPAGDEPAGQPRRCSCTADGLCIRSEYPQAEPAAFRRAAAAPNNGDYDN